MPDGSLKLNAASEIAEENNTKLAKVVWLSAKYNGRAFSSLVAYFMSRRRSYGQVTAVRGVP